MSDNVIENENSFKVIMVGDTNVGKTCIINRASQNKFLKNAFPTSIANFEKLTVNINSVNINLHINDMAGQETYRNIAPLYFHGARAAIIVYSIDQDSSFKDIDIWYQLISDNLDITNINIYLVANKIDLFDEPTDVSLISEEQGKQKAESLNIPFFTVSAKNGKNVSDLFRFIAQKFVDLTENKKVIILDDSEKEKKCC